MPRTQKSANNEIHELQEGLSALQDDLASLAGMVRDLTGANDDLPHAVAARVQDGLRKSARWARHAGEETRHHAQAGLEAARKQVQERPLATLATALGLGLIAGQILSGRR